MAQNKPTEQNRSQDTTRSGASPARVDREREIATEQDRGARRTPARPYGAQVRDASPFALMRRMAEDMDRLFDSFGFGRTGLLPLHRSWLDDDTFPTTGTQQALWTPQVEMLERGDKLVVRADLPGLRREDVNVEVDDGTLTISGERKQEHEENREGFYRSERSYGQFYRSIPLPDGVDADQVDASFRDGVLEVSFTAPREQRRQARRISIR